MSFPVYISTLSFLLLAIISPLVSGDGRSRFNPEEMQSNMWRESREAVIKADKRTLYAKDRHCEPPEPAEALQLHSHNNASWSMLFSRYTLDAGDELDVWLANQEKYNETAHEKHEENPLDILIPVFFPIFFAIFLTISVVVIPFLGAIAFRILLVMWWMITHDEVRRTGRRVLIIQERSLRKRQRILMPSTVKKPPKSRFHLPSFFRLYPDEDIPSELEESDEDENWSLSESEEGKDKQVGGASLSGLNTETSQDEGEEEVIKEADNPNDEQEDVKEEMGVGGGDVVN